MAEEDMFQIRRGVLRFHRPPDSGELLFLCWPVLAYRVTAPVLAVRHLNIIERVVLALCRAGVRRPEDIAEKIHQSAELCEHVLRQLREGGRVDRYGVPTALGRETLDTGRVGAEAELIVTHVLQDPLTGRLWPRAARDLVFQRVHGVRDGQAELRLDSAGSPRPITARIVGEGVDLVRPRPPGAQQVIDAVAAQRQAELARRAERFTDFRNGRSPAAHTAERDLQALATELTMPHETAVHRVLDTGRPMAEYLLVWLSEGDGQDGGPRVRDPFGLEPNSMLRRTLTEWIREDPGLADAVSGAADTASARVGAEYRAAGDAVRRAAESRLVQRLGGELRRRPEALTLLLGLEEAAARGGESGVESVAREAYRLHEHLFRRLVAEYPPPERPSWAAGARAASVPTVRSALATAAKALGLDRPRGSYLDGMNVGKALTEYPKQVRMHGRAIDVERAYVRDLLPYALIAAADPKSPHRRDHPLRELARDRPGVLADLEQLRELRNRGSHATRDATVEDDIDWCRRLALDAARLIVSMPPTPLERN
ncbi:hypothetical protein [Actinomadura litoris]|nr:hypothetical protein [Actinomadura litoris]